MNEQLDTTGDIKTLNFELSETIQKACLDIATKCFQCTDPTKVSVRYLEADEKLYPSYGIYDYEAGKSDIARQILDTLGINMRENGKYSDHTLITLVFRGILNVCQLVDDEETQKTYSLPLNPEYIQERLSFPEVIADIILYQVLTGCSDRKIQLQDDPRTQTNEWIVPHNCRIFSQGTYSIFDIEGTFKKIEKDEVEELMYYHLKYLFSEYEIEARDFQEHIDGEIAFGETMIQRILKKVGELLERYESTEGKILFLRQCAESSTSHRYIPNRIKNILSAAEDIWYEDELQYYNNFIFSLSNIKNFFETHEEPFRNTQFLRKDAKRKIIYHLRKLTEYIKQWFFPAYTI